MPNMTDPYFSKSVIFICEYNNNGAVGFIINKPVNTMKIISSGINDKFFKDLLSQSKKIYFGGPVSIHEACILSDKNTKEALLDMSAKIKLSNDLELIKSINGYLKTIKIEKSDFDFELLYGIRRDLSKELKDKGHRVRLYVPFGTEWLPYTLRRLKEIKNLKFVVFNIVREIFRF